MRHEGSPTFLSVSAWAKGRGKYGDTHKQARVFVSNQESNCIARWWRYDEGCWRSQNRTDHETRRNWSVIQSNGKTCWCCLVYVLPHHPISQWNKWLSAISSLSFPSPQSPYWWHVRTSTQPWYFSWTTISPSGTPYKFGISSYSPLIS